MQPTNRAQGLKGQPPATCTAHALVRIALYPRTAGRACVFHYTVLLHLSRRRPPPLCSQPPPKPQRGEHESPSLAPSAAMEGAFRLNMGIALCLNRKLPYGDKSSEMDFFEAAVKGNLDRLRGKPVGHRRSTECFPGPFSVARCIGLARKPSIGFAFVISR
ncbi:hypothetical protein PR202_ga13002 [Eleusine coracana subsp. coracana]|uniref:Uncharacterized protein n=1 Tax=Eleusine coracana subsp. coracana TaxID=191504 RepID=A0AAV5CCZ8_ELECO|nr:hypothetical protein PR202_ga13002 [Eleusine coracana subsp. coracana]